MRAECITAVAKAIGRSLTVAEAKGIEDRIVKNMRRLAVADRQAYASMPRDVRLTEAGKLAAQELIHDAQLKKLRTALTVVAHDRIERYVAAHPDGRLDALGRTLAPKGDGRDNFNSADSRATAIRDLALADLSEGIDKLGPTWLGLMTNREGARSLVMEIRGQDSGVPEAKAAAQVWKDVTETLRLQFNRAGGDVGHLTDWGTPQHHSQHLVAKAGRDQWINDVLPLLDRNRYVRESDGGVMTDSEVRTFLDNAYDTISTGGLNKMEPGRAGAGLGMRANRGNESRQVHFQDADSYLAYHDLYGDKDLMGTLIQHIDGAARDIAMVEVLGPNPDHTYRLFKENSVQAAALADPTKVGKATKQAAFIDSLYANVSGKHPPIADAALARGFDAVRNWLVSTRLGSALISSFSDEATMHLTAHVNNLPAAKLFMNELTLLNPANMEDRRALRRMGLGLDTLSSSINRAGQDFLVNGFTKRVATFTMRASGLNAWTDAHKQAFGATYMDALAHLTRTTDFAKLDPTDNRILLSKGITADDWNVWKLAQPEDWNGNELLTPQAIARIPDADLAAAGYRPEARREAMIKLLSAIQEETDIAIIQPGARERSIMHGNEPRGTWRGELTRSFFLFKAFPIAMVTRHWRRALSMETKGGTAAYAAALLAGTTVMGALSVQVSNLITGRDPANMNPFEGDRGMRFWVAALLKGGSLGMYGDYLASQTTHHGTGALGGLLGPIAGETESVLNLTQGNLVQMAMGEDTKAGAEAVRLIKGLIPGSSLWYAKTALDHMIFHQLQEFFSPGYLSTMQSRARREFGDTYFWQPGGDLSDARGPDWAKAAGN